MSILLASLSLFALNPDKADVELSDVPEAVIGVAKSVRPDVTFTEAERETRNGVIYYDLEGEDSAGHEWELDIMQTDDGWEVVEIQRDIDAKTAPAPVLAALKEMAPDFAVTRTIESTQTDGRIVYEFFDADGGKREVLWDGEAAEFLEEEWEH